MAYQWHRDPWSSSGCPGTYLSPGWYSGTTPITGATTYRNPSTGKPYTPAELEALVGGAAAGENNTGITGTVTGTTPTVPNLPTTGEQPGKIYFGGQLIGQIPYAEWADFEALSQKEKESYIKEKFGIDVSGQMWASTPAANITQQQIDQMLTPHPDGAGGAGGTPTFGGDAVVSIPTPEVTPAPPYEISPEQEAWEEMYGGKLTEWLEAGGYGIPEETQAQMIQAQTDVIKAKETEDIRVMRNNMERRGITNSGFIFSNEQNIRSNTTVTIANSIRDIQIQNALIKMSSFEKAMGAASQFLGYLSEQSQLKYQTEFATWQAEQIAKMQAWQAQLDIYKMQINQAYTQQNLQLQAQLQSQLAVQQHQYDLQLAQMEIEAQQQAADAAGTGQLIGGLIGGIATIAAATI